MLTDVKEIKFTVSFNTKLYLFLKEKFSRKFYRYLKSSNALFFVNGSSCSITTDLNIGDLLVIRYYDKSTSIKWDLDYTPLFILYKDLNYLVCYKEPGILTIPTKNSKNSLYQQLLANLNIKSFKILNRLDKDTSGLILVALDRYSANLVSDFNKLVKRKYYAILYGNVCDLDISLCIKKCKDSIKREVSDDGKFCLTNVRVLAFNKGFYFSEIEILTGRTHQIRVSLAHYGIYILGDTMYSNNLYSYYKMCLESYCLSFFDYKFSYTRLWDDFLNL